MDKEINQGRETIRLPLYDAGIVRSPYAAPATGYEQYYLNCWAEKYHEPGSTQNAAETALMGRTGLAPSPLFGTTMASYAGAGSGTQAVMLTNMAMTNLYDCYICAMFDYNSGGAGNPFIKILMYRPIGGVTVNICTIQFTGATGVGNINPGVNPNVNDRVFITEIVNGNNLDPGIVFTWQGADRVTSAAGYAISITGVFGSASSQPLTSATGFAPFVASKVLTGPFQQMNGNTYIMTQDGFIYNSSLNSSGNPDIATWNALSTVAASQYPDNGIGIYRYKHMLLAVGTDSIEFFSPDNNNPPASPLVHTDQAFIKFGALSNKLCINVDDIFYWISYGTGPTIGLWKLDGYTPVKISTPKEDQILVAAYKGGYNYSHLTIEALSIANKRHICLNGIFPGQLYSVSNTTCLCLNVEDNVWWWMYLPPKNGGTTTCYAILPATAQPGFTAAANLVGGYYSQYCFRRGTETTPAGGTMPNQLDLASVTPHQWQATGTATANYTDSFVIAGSSGTSTDQIVTGKVALRNYWFTNGKRKRINRISVFVDPVSVTGTQPVVSISASRNNLVSFLTRSDFTQQLNPFGTNGETMGVAYANNWGSGRCLAILLNWTAGFRCTAIEVDLQQNDH